MISFFLVLKLKLVELSIKKPEKQEAQVVLLSETEQVTLNVFGSTCHHLSPERPGLDDYIMRIFQLSNDVIVGFLLVARWPIEVRGLWFSS